MSLNQNSAFQVSQSQKTAAKNNNLWEEDLMEQLMPLIIQLISGAVGGNVIGALAKKLSLGFLGNTVAGLVGGGLSGHFLGDTVGAMLGSGMLGDVGAAAGGGGIVMVVVGLIKSMMSK